MPLLTRKKIKEAERRNELKSHRTEAKMVKYKKKDEAYS